MQEGHDEDSEHLKKLNEEEQRDRERAYFPVQNVGMVLLEIIPLDKKDDLTNGLAKLFEAPERLKLQNLGDRGILAAGWSLHIGTLMNGKTPEWPGENVYKDLPDPFKWVDVNIGQVFNFCFYLVACCMIKEDYRGRIKEKFLEAGIWKSTKESDGVSFSTAGPDLEPTIRDYQKQIEDYLAGFVKGLFLSRETNVRVRCPSIRVMMADKVEFEHYDSWFDAHLPFLRFLGSYFASRVEDHTLVSYQEDRLLKEASVSSGMNFICSKAGYRSVTSDPIEKQSLQNASFILERVLIYHFVATYWSQYQLELLLPEWERKSKALEEDLQTIVHSSRSSLGPLRSTYSGALQLLNSFETYALEEEKNVEKMLTEISRKVPAIKSEPANRTGIKLDVIHAFVEGSRFLVEESARLSTIRRSIHSVTSRCRQYTDFKVTEANVYLTTRIKMLTEVLVVFTALLAGFQIYSYIIPSAKLTPFSTFAWIVASALAVFFAVVIGVRSLIGDEIGTFRKRPSLKTITRVILITTLISGVLLSGAGVGVYISNSTSGGSYDNLSSIDTGVILGWDPYDSPVIHPIIQIGVAPFINKSQTSDIIFDIEGTIDTNKTFTFGFISPFLITSVREFGQGNWSYQNVRDLGSTIYYTFKLNSTLTGGFLAGNAVFYFTNLPARVDHGSYMVFIPFGGGLTFQFQSAMNMTHVFTYDHGQNFLFDLDIPLTYRVTSSYPAFSSPIPELGPLCCGIQQSLQALQYQLNGTAALSVNYEDSETISQFSASQSRELFFLGLGVPLLLSSLLELAKFCSRDGASTKEH